MVMKIGKMIRLTMTIPLFMWSLGCTPTERDAETFLLDLTNAHAALTEQLKSDIGYSRSELTEEMEDGETRTIWDGTYTWSAIEVTGDGIFEREGISFQSLIWSLEVTYLGQSVSEDMVTGTALLTIDETISESTLSSHDYAGDVVLNGRSHEVHYTALLSASTVQSLTGAVDDEHVDWETSSPDMP